MIDERAPARECSDATVVRGSSLNERAEARGRYEIECIGADGELKWRDVIDNIVMTVGKNSALDAFLSGASYTVVGPYLGLISSVSYMSISAGDTMTSHSGWLEAGGANAPVYSSTRRTAVWAAATGGSKQLTAPLSFPITGSGIVKGVFLVYGPGAVNTVDDTNGVLWSAGTFGSGDKPVIATDTLNVNYSVSL
jgi:hypothetical protein